MLFILGLCVSCDSAQNSAAPLAATNQQQTQATALQRGARPAMSPSLAKPAARLDPSRAGSYKVFLSLIQVGAPLTSSAPLSATHWLTSTTLAVIMRPRPTATPTHIMDSALTTSSLTETVNITQVMPSRPPITQLLTATIPLLQPTPDGHVRTAKVPILMYHYISDAPADADIYRRDLSVNPKRFAAQLDRMQADGYTTINLYDLVDNLTKGTPLPPKPVILTFDDGYRDNYENAFPLLKAHGMKATFFIITDFIDAQRPEYLTWDMVRAMYKAGMSIESHSRNHVSLRGRDQDFLVWQALGSAETIKAEIGVQPRFICYPAGEYDQKTIEIFKSANYWAGITTMQGATHKSDDLFELRRVRIRGTTTPDQLASLLGVDW